MHRSHLAAALVAATLATVARAEFVVLPGGLSSKDCWNGFQVETSNAIVGTTSRRIKALACDGKCTFGVRACVALGQPAGCAPVRLSRLQVEGLPSSALPPVRGPLHACGVTQKVTVPLGPYPKKRSWAKLSLVGKRATPFGWRTDRDRITLYCLRNPTGACDTCPTSCDNVDGGPDRLIVRFGDTGSDLDIGWTGEAHNFRAVMNAQVDACVSGCDGTADTQCDVCAQVFPGTGSAPTFGPPVPLLASNVPVCLVHRFGSNVFGTADPATGAVSLDLKLQTDVHLTAHDSVCPQCRNGQCDGGVNAGKVCAVEASVPVYVSPTRSDQYDLSSTCIPSSPVAMLETNFAPLTTGTATPLVGPTPCVAAAGEPTGIPPQADQCGASGCGAECTGAACVSKEPDPTDPDRLVCIDVKGGVSRACCNNQTQQPCFPLQSTALAPHGFTTPPEPLVSSASTSTTPHAVLVSTFCAKATGANTIDVIDGLPGPAAIELSGTIDWIRD